ncbi:hypothetical protein ASPZODRAFT_18693 [Penicilliopsis zonata CBS 506.65]|uniref:Methyltransferase domain-containing protein n=1 Tax=Penicilliopsis zonata CBS 506.65 TaxID=1073090 RepID=A0A1L9S9S8_9EURO|nr:hypothetical protein ASPZODRAFT_18693 [Penicilliopsis zonata CBS 506.65]OJJ43914.1 hypothetical protein ASPZODRAFT_18693 [Penicilliopsis zonata CBS 506.65]
MTDLTDDSQYLVGRNFRETARLNGQHFAINLHLGYGLHPSVPIHDGMKIADIGTGTGVWILELADKYPTVVFEGYDVSSAAFPPRHVWGENVSFAELDALQQVPDEMKGQYDVVHMRLLCSFVRGNDPSKLVNMAKSLLKEGGYLQWEESIRDPSLLQVQSAIDFERMYEKAWQALNLQFDWPEHLPEILATHGFDVLHARCSGLNRAAAWLWTPVYLQSCAGVLAELRQVGFDTPAEEIEEALHRIYVDAQQGNVFGWRFSSVLARMR